MWNVTLWDKQDYLQTTLVKPKLKLILNVAQWRVSRLVRTPESGVIPLRANKSAKGVSPWPSSQGTWSIESRVTGASSVTSVPFFSPARPWAPHTQNKSMEPYPVLHWFCREHQNVSWWRWSGPASKPQTPEVMIMCGYQLAKGIIFICLFL